ncbi:2107_t:CDS:2, partial [Racocetra persica]
VGKSTVGNMLLKACENYEERFETYEGPYDGYDGKDFILVDTPGFTKEKSRSTWGEIDKVIDKSYEHGIHAFLFRFTSDRRSHLDECMKKLNNDNVIIVFTKSSKVETETPEKMRDSFADFVKEYIEKVNHRWVVAPNPDIYDEHNY